MNRIAFVLYASIIFLGGCKSYQSTTTKTTSPSGKYTEDLSSLRPKAAATVDTAQATDQPFRKTTYVEPKYSVNKPLDNVLDSINRINVSRKAVDGFTIQIYSGLDREAALLAKKELATSLPEVSSEIQYTQPNFRVKAGRYFNRLDAQKDFVSIKKYFPSAIVVPDKIQIN